MICYRVFNNEHPHHSLFVSTNKEKVCKFILDFHNKRNYINETFNLRYDFDTDEELKVALRNLEEAHQIFLDVVPVDNCPGQDEVMEYIRDGISFMCEELPFVE